MTDTRPGSLHHHSMASYPLPRIVSAERLDTGVVIAFDDGKCALYSSFLLHATFSEAEEITTEEEDLF